MGVPPEYNPTSNPPIFHNSFIPPPLKITYPIITTNTTLIKAINIETTVLPAILNHARIFAENNKRGIANGMVIMVIKSCTLPLPSGNTPIFPKTSPKPYASKTEPILFTMVNL